MDHLFILILIESFSGSSVKSNKSSQPINTSTKKIGPRMQQWDKPINNFNNCPWTIYVI